MSERDEFEAWVQKEGIVELTGMWRAWQAARATQAVPEGWRLVPEVATEEMIQAGCLNQCAGGLSNYQEWWDSHSSGLSERIRDLLARDYRAMLAAAPQPSQEQPARQKYQD